MDAVITAAVAVLVSLATISATRAAEARQRSLTLFDEVLAEVAYMQSRLIYLDSPEGRAPDKEALSILSEAFQRLQSQVWRLRVGEFDDVADAMEEIVDAVAKDLQANARNPEPVTDLTNSMTINLAVKDVVARMSARADKARRWPLGGALGEKFAAVAAPMRAKASDVRGARRSSSG